jgi:hypothetical protein
MADAPFDVEKAHRWFGIEFNNLAWDLVEASARSEADVERMIHAAHASTHHWLQIGTPLHHQRGQCLLATVYAVAGLPDAAIRHASRCLSLSQENGADQSTFDRATAYGAAALAHRAAGQADRAAELYAQAVEAANTFEDPDETTVFRKLYSTDRRP